MGIFDLFVLILCIDGLALIFSVGYMLFMIFAFILYKSDKGKLNFWQYAKWWMKYM